MVTLEENKPATHNKQKRRTSQERKNLFNQPVHGYPHPQQKKKESRKTSVYFYRVFFILCLTCFLMYADNDIVLLADCVWGEICCGW